MKRRDLLAGLALAPIAASAAPLPPPSHGIPGLVRVAGPAALAKVVGIWARAFMAAHPHIRVTAQMHGSDIAMAALTTAQCDIALIGRDATKPEIQAFEWIYRAKPSALPVLQGSLATADKSPALAVMVHRSNPLAAISLADLRAAFGDETRKARHWGDLGLGGAWRDRPITLYMPPAESGTGRFFRAAVLADSNRLAWGRLHEFSDPQQLHRALAKDPTGLAIGMASMGNPALRIVPISRDNAPPLLPTAATVAHNSYPLTRRVWAYFAPVRHSETQLLLDFITSAEAKRLLPPSAGYLLPI